MLEVMNFSEDEKEGYESHLKWLRIQTNTIKKYEQQARDEGRIEGEAIGEAKNRVHIATKLIQLELSTEMIVDATGLTREEIEAIKADNK